MASPRKKNARSVSTGDVKIQLKHTDTGASRHFVILLIALSVPFTIIIVPIFDGQEQKIELDQSLQHLNEFLPLFADEIPPGSLALVAYTANSYYHAQKGGQSKWPRSQSKNLALNINWVIVLGVPK